MAKLNQASRSIWKLVNHYLASNYNMIENFFRGEITVPLTQHHIQILTGNQIKEIITTNYSKEDLIKTVRNNKRHNNHNFEAKTIKRALHILTKVCPIASNNNLAIFDLMPQKENNYNFNSRPLDKDDIYWIKDELLTFLEQDIGIKLQIKWLLRYKTIPDTALAKKTKINASQITRYRKGNLKVGNMSINNAEKLQKYYYLVVSNQLVGHDVPLTAKDIEKSFH